MGTRTKVNLLFQISYQIINTCIPLIITPYLARCLGLTNLGIFSYSSSIVSYFTLAAMLGTITYGTRSIAACGDSLDARNKRFSEIYYFQLFFSIISLLFYLCLCLLFKDNRLIFLIQGILIFSCFFDVTWFFFGIEKFKLIVLRSFVIRIVSVISIFLFVKSTNDLWIYTVIMSCSTLLTHLLVFVNLRKYISFKKVKIFEVFKHFKRNFVLFVPLLAMSIYHSMDKTMLGALSNDVQSGLYYNADKVINIPLGVVAGIGTVMLPRITSLYEKNEKDKANVLLKLSIELISILCVGMVFGIVAISNDFVPIFFGEGYDDCIILIIVLSPVIVLKGISETIRTQFLIPLKKEKVFIISVLAGAILNLILNLILIPKTGALGAVIATLVAEFGAFVVQIIFIMKQMNLIRILMNLTVYIGVGFIMFITLGLFSRININVYVKLVAEIITGAFIYVGFIVFYSVVFNKNLLKKIRYLNN